MSANPENRPDNPVAAADSAAEADEGLGRVVEGDAPPVVIVSGPVEEGPRRRLLVVLAAVVGAVLLWLLFRSVPDQAVPAPAPPASQSESVEDVANASDPSWMNADTSRHVPGAPGSFVPPVYGPPGGTPAEGQVQQDSTAAGAAPGAAPGAGAAEQSGAPADPRREAFLTALRSKPLQGGASFGQEAAAQGAGPDNSEIAAPPSLEVMQAAAEAEATRRSVPSGAANGSPGFSAPGSPTAPVSEYGTTVQQRSGSQSSYNGGSSGPGPQAAAPLRMSSRAAVAELVIPVGTIIEGQLHTSVISDLPGHVVGMVTRNVYDATQRAVVVPMYSWLFGTYESDVATGQARLVVQWTAIRFPTGETFDLPALRAGDQAGASGLRGRVNNHYGRIFGQALLSSVVAGAFVGRTSDGSTATRSSREAIAEAAAQQLGQTASEVTRRNLDIKPTITVPRLTRFSIILDRDLVFTAPARR